MTHPYSIPDQYKDAPEMVRDAYDLGLNAGHGIACHNVPDLDSKVSTWSEGSVIVDADNIRDIHETLCFEGESNSRSFSPFELTAAEFNDSDDSDSLWEAYDDGVTYAIQADIASYSDEDYGIDSEVTENE